MTPTTGSRMGHRRAMREVVVALALILAVLIVGANFVLVDVRLLGIETETRLGWALLAAFVLGYGAGVLRRRGA